MIADIETNNNDDFIITDKDIRIKKGEESKLIALSNYLKNNKKKIIELDSRGLQTLILSKCLALNININTIRYKEDEIRKGIFNLTISMIRGN